MFCPNCGQEKLGTEATFCSRCGFLLTGTAELLNRGGGVLPPAVTTTKDSPRKRGLKQGLFIFLLTFVVVPIAAMLSMAVHIGPGFVGVAAVLLFMGGLLRMAYSLLFEDNAIAAPSGLPQAIGPGAQRALPPEQTVSAESYAYKGPGNWRDTNDLQPLVTENTTRLLEHEQPPQ